MYTKTDKMKSSMEYWAKKTDPQFSQDIEVTNHETFDTGQQDCTHQEVWATSLMRWRWLTTAMTQGMEAGKIPVTYIMNNSVYTQY